MNIEQIHPQESLDERLRIALSAKECDHSLVKQLIADGANPSQQDNHGNCLLNDAIQEVMDSGDLSKVTLLLELGADVNNLFHDEERPILDSMYVANFELFMKLIDAGADVNFLLDEMESLLDWAEFDRSYHAHHSNDDERDREIVRFFDASIPVLKSKGAKKTDEFIVDTPKKFVQISRNGLWTASGNLRIEGICPDMTVVQRFLDWRERSAEVWPKGPMPCDFARHSHNLEGLAIAVELRRMVDASIEIRFGCLDPIPCWWFQRNFVETIVPVGARSRIPLSYEDGGHDTEIRGDVVLSAIIDVEESRIQIQARVLCHFQPLPFACHYTELENAIRSEGTRFIEGWDAQKWDREIFQVKFINDGVTIQIDCQHPGLECAATLSLGSITKSVTLPDGRARYILKSHEYALWQARRLKGYHSETTFWWI